jgi:hypothetical protein
MPTVFKDRHDNGTAAWALRQAENNANSDTITDEDVNEEGADGASGEEGADGASASGARTVDPKHL